jgi:hypothetical protein
MADVKISGLPASTTPLAGTEVLPLVQSGVTKKVAVSNLTGTNVSNAGEVGIGGDTAGVIAGVAVTSKFCVKQDGTNPVAGFVKAENTTAGSGSGTFACRSRGTIAAPTVVQNNDSLWNMYIAGYDGTDLALAAEIDVQVDGAPGANDMPGRIVFKTTPDGSQIPAEAMRINSAQNVTITTGNLIIGTAGKGIDFSGVGTAAEILDDYEEGSWTVQLFDASSGGNASATTVTGYYTKIGRQVTCSFFNLNDINTTGMTAGNILHVSLPFSAAASVGNGIGACSTEVFDFGLGRTQINPEVPNGAARGRFILTGSNVANEFIRVSNVTTGLSDIERFTLTYFTV